MTIEIIIITWATINVCFFITIINWMTKIEMTQRTIVDLMAQLTSIIEVVGKMNRKN